MSSYKKRNKPKVSGFNETAGIPTNPLFDKPIPNQNPLPGQTVQPGSIGIGIKPNSWTSSGDPESAWWSDTEGKNTLPLIWQLLQNSNNGGSLSQGYSALLNQLVSMSKDPKTSLNPDLIMSIFSNLLSYQTTQDQRQYDWTLKQDERNYNTPTNELARLMGAGISRDAALQILSGGASGGSGVGSDATQMMGMTGSAGSAAAYSAGAQQGLANTIFNGLNTFGNLVNMGFGVAQSYQQTQYLKNQNVLLRGQAESYQAVGDLYSLMQMLGAKDDDYSSLRSAAKFVTTAAQSGNADAAQFISSGRLKSLYKHPNFSSKSLSQLNRSENDAGLFISELRTAAAQALKEERTAELVSQEILKAQEDLEYIAAETDLIKQQEKTSAEMAKVYEQQAEYLKKQGKVAEAQEVLIQAQKLKVDAETTGINLQNQQTNAWMTDTYAGKTGLQWMTNKTIYEMCRDAQVAEKMTNPQFASAKYFSIFNSYEKVAYAEALNRLNSQLGLAFANKYPALYQQWTILDQAGAYKFLDAIANGRYNFDAKTGVSLFGVDFGFEVNTMGNTTVDYLEGLGNYGLTDEDIKNIK